MSERPEPVVGIDIEAKVARCRLILSMIAMVAVYVDPTAPTLIPWLASGGGSFSIDPWALVVMTAHLLYSLAVYWLVTSERVARGRLAVYTTWTDVLFGTAIVVCTEGTSSPFWAFFVFAVVSASVHGGLRRSLAVTTVSVASYMSLILFAWRGDTNVYIMRPVYLAVVGYLCAYLGEERLNLEAEVHQLETVKERNRIARALHDGSVQTLGGVNLTLESCRALIRAGRGDEALAGLAELQRSVNREHDALRAWVRELADVEPDQPVPRPEDLTRFVVTADFAGSGGFVDQVLQLAREAVTNVRRHAGARSAMVTIRAADSQVHISIDDDGVGFANPDHLPWSMSSRISEAGGIIRVIRDGRPGAHLKMALPEA